MKKLFMDGRAMNLFTLHYDGNKITSIVWRNDKGQVNKEDGPAFENFKGYKQWRINGQLHREDGPAIIDPCNLYEEYWENGRLLTHRYTK